MGKRVGTVAGFGLAVTAMIGLTGCSTPLNDLPTLQAAPEGAYRVDSGDRLRIAVRDLDEATGEYVVDETGSISLPMIEPLAVRGLSYNEIEGSVTQALLARGILNQPIVNVQPVALRPFYVMGEVNSPGAFDYLQGMTVLSAVAAAGGYTYRAKEGEVAVTRTVNGQQVTFRAAEDTPVQPGDRLLVVERWF